MYSVTGDTTSLVPGFPIRTSSDPRSVGSSPRHIAASNVLHRLPVPRHPPCALTHLQTQKPIRKKKLHIHKQAPRREPICEMLATTIHKSNTTPHHQSRATTVHPHPQAGKQQGLLSQSPIVCSMIPAGASPRPTTFRCAPNPRPLQPWDSSRHGHDPVSQPFSWCSLERR